MAQLDPSRLDKNHAYLTLPLETLPEWIRLRPWFHARRPKIKLLQK